MPGRYRRLPGGPSWVDACRRTVLIVTLLSATSVVHCVVSRDCMSAQQRCQTKVGCGAAYLNYERNCADVQKGATKNCSDNCKKAVISLLTNEDGHGTNLLNCDCKDNAICTEQKERMDACDLQSLFLATDSVNDNHTIIDCNQAKWVCDADTQCHTALGFVYQRCLRAFSGKECTPACNNSLNILYSRPKAKKLRQCNCKGSENVFGYGLIECDRLKFYTEKLCYNRVPTKKPIAKDDRNTYKTVNGACTVQCNLFYGIANAMLLYFSAVQL